LLLLLAGVALGWNLSGHRLLDPDEGRNAEVAREMAQSNDYVVPHLDGLPYLDKPIVYVTLGTVFNEAAPLFKKILDEGRAGDNVGLLLRGIEREEIERGQVMAKAGSIKPHTTFKAQVYVLTKEEGGRHTPFYNGYRPQFYLRTTDVTGAISLPDGAEMVMPGDNVEMGVELITPIALEIGQRFAIREGGRTVGAGAITSITE